MRRRAANFGDLELQEVPRCRQFLTVLISKSLSRAGGVPILAMSTSKSVPRLPVLTIFDFQIPLARRRGADFVDILSSRSSVPARS